MTSAEVLLAAALVTPLAVLAAGIAPGLRRHQPGLLPVVPLPALLVAAVVPHGTSIAPFLGFTFVLDAPAAMLLAASALLWTAAGVVARTYLRHTRNAARFATWWVATLAGNVGVLLTADIVGFYLFFTLASLAAYGLIVHEGGAARRAGAVYVFLAVLCEAFLIIAFVLVAAGVPDGSLRIGDAVIALAQSPWRDPALAFLLLGFGLKIGLVPWHVWMPLTYTAAPIPAAAVLSGAAVKIGVIGLIRFLPFESASVGWGEALAAVGLFSAFYGVAVGVTQSNPKTVLAYSSVSQMGLLAAVLGMGFAGGDAHAALAAAFYATNHVLVKGGLFLCMAAPALTDGRRNWLVMLPAAVLALALAGLPLTGGALAKSAVKSALGDGLAGTLAALSAAGSTLLMLHFLRCLYRDTTREPVAASFAATSLPWLATAFAALALPWSMFHELGTPSWRDALGPGELWSACWPLLLGGLVAYGLRSWQPPRIPEGDVLAAGESARHATQRLGDIMEDIDSRLRQWPTAGMLLIGCVILMAGTLLLGR